MSLLRLTWLKFLLAGGRVNSNSGTGSLAARRTSLPESPRTRVCIGQLATYVRVTSLSPLSRASSARAPLDRLRQWWEKGHGAGLLLLRQVSLELKCEACKSNTRYLQTQPATPRTTWHPCPRAEDVLCKKAFCPPGNWQMLPLASPDLETAD